jgi:hypothetical protein
MKKIALITVISFTATWMVMVLLEKLLDSEMPDWMKEQVNKS